MLSARRLIVAASFALFAAGPFARAQVPMQYRAPESVSTLAAGLLGAVVNISTSQTVKGMEETESPPTVQGLEGTPFQEFFQDFFSDKNGKNQSRKVQSLGSGFVIDAREGLIVTNNHVIADADEIEVNFTDGTKLKAKLLGKDPKTDLALLKIDPKAKKLTAVEFGDSRQAKIGDWVMAIGNPFGFGGSVTVGIISARNRNINAGPYDDFIQTDAAINRGNSGGPLFDMNGKVIGINTAIVSPSGGSIGIGFAIPSELAINVISQLKEFGETRRGWLAIRIQPVTADVAQALNLPKAEGALVSGKIEDAKVGNQELRDGDVIIRFGDKPIRNAGTLPRIVAESPVGQVVNVVVLRNGKEKTVRVKLGLLDEKTTEEETDSDEPQEDGASYEETGNHVLGMQLGELDDAASRKYSIAKDVSGVVVLSVDPNSSADEKRIRAGNVIVDINQEVVKTPHDVEKRLAVLKDTGRKNALLLVAAPTGELRFVAVRLD